MRGAEVEPYIVPVGDGAGVGAGWVRGTVKAVLLFRLASLAGEDEATEFPAAPETVVTE
jgi:hypothetical protein